MPTPKNEHYSELSTEVAALAANQAHLQRDIGTVSDTVKHLSESVQKGFEHLGTRIDNKSKPHYMLIVTVAVFLIGVVGVYISNSTGPLTTELVAYKDATAAHLNTIDRTLLRQEDTEVKNRELIMQNVQRTIQTETFIELLKGGLINLPSGDKSNKIGHPAGGNCIDCHTSK